ncbi:hypothetical protein [Pedobacter gandavensis]|uniref:hypothetical protein n=1 Tax=Pedobacter gandavensis TaxID=2679963 RepID=UPI00292F596C|nr:hypothetical protein [Pedobacter gandavensis]
MSLGLSPYWHRLLRHFERKGYIQNGLTIPFLIGALEVMEPDAKQWTINEMTESLNNIGCTILKCSNIGEFVIGSLDTETLKCKKLYHKPCDKIIVTDSSLDQVKFFVELLSLFDRLYQSRLDNKEFSKNDGSWTYFTRTDLDRIKETI